MLLTGIFWHQRIASDSFTLVEDGNGGSRGEYFNSLTGAVEFADLMERQGHSVTVEIELQALLQ